MASRGVERDDPGGWFLVGTQFVLVDLVSLARTRKYATPMDPRKRGDGLVARRDTLEPLVSVPTRRSRLQFGRKINRTVHDCAVSLLERTLDGI